VVIKTQYFHDEFDALHLGLQRYIRMQRIPVVERPAVADAAPEPEPTEVGTPAVADAAPEPEPTVVGTAAVADAAPDPEPTVVGTAAVADAAPEPDPTVVDGNSIDEEVASYSSETSRSRRRRHDR
jgi:hypothetical protein